LFIEKIKKKKKFKGWLGFGKVDLKVTLILLLEKIII